MASSWFSLYSTYTEMFRRVREIAESYYQLHRVSPSVRMGQLSSHWTNFDEISYLLFENLARKFRFRYNLRRITGTSHEELWIYVTFMIISHLGLLMRNITEKIVEKIKTRILCSKTSPPPENRTVYGIMWKNAVKPDRTR